MKATDWIAFAGIVVAGLGIGTIEAHSIIPVLLIGIGTVIAVSMIKLDKKRSASRRQAKEARKNAA